VWSKKHGQIELEHVGSAHDDTELAVLMAVARERLHQGEDELDFRLPVVKQNSLEITSTRMGRLLDTLGLVYRHLGLDQAAGGDQVFEQLVTARIIEPTSKWDSSRVLDEAGWAPMSYSTLKRRLPVYATDLWRAKLSSVLAARADLGSSSLVLYDVTTLWFETDVGDGFREPGFSKERRLEPQITVGLLTDSGGFPLMVDAFEGNRAETTTMIPLIRGFVEAHGITGVTVVADAGMMSEANLKAIEDTGWTFIVGGRISDIPYAVKQWQQAHLGQQFPDQLIVSQKQMMGVTPDVRERTVIFQWRADRARRSIHGIDQQILKAEKAVAGKTSVKSNRFVTITGGTKTVNRELEMKARNLAGWKSYISNLDAAAEFIIGAYHQLWHVEHSFRMSKHDLRARPVFHHKRESIDAHLAIVFAALAVSHWIEQATGWTISRFVKALRLYRQVGLNVNGRAVTAEQPIPAEISDMLTTIRVKTGH
jgi:hypothetical protein